MAQWWPRYCERAAGGKPDPFDTAVAGGYAADRVGWAFASGYQAALRALFPGVPADRICALCVTEEDGNSPKAIKTSLARSPGGWRLDGTKKWTTLGPEGSLFFVAARDAAAPGARASIRVAKIDSRAEGVAIERMPATRFVPEVPHARLRFDKVSVAAEALLPGDGYDDYVRPFRTVEDVHVNAAILAYLVREARRLSWPDAWTEKALALLASLRQIDSMSPASPPTHVLLAGALALSGGLMRDTEAFWEAAAPDPAAERWARDRELLKVAGSLREQRTRRAWERLRAPS